MHSRIARYEFGCIPTGRRAQTEPEDHKPESMEPGDRKVRSAHDRCSALQRLPAAVVCRSLHKPGCRDSTLGMPGMKSRNLCGYPVALPPSHVTSSDRALKPHDPVYILVEPRYTRHTILSQGPPPSCWERKACKHEKEAKRHVRTARLILNGQQHSTNSISRCQQSITTTMMANAVQQAPHVLKHQTHPIRALSLQTSNTPLRKHAGAAEHGTGTMCGTATNGAYVARCGALLRRPQGDKVMNHFRHCAEAVARLPTRRSARLRKSTHPGINERYLLPRL